MVNNKEQGTYEDTLNKSEATFLKYKKPFLIAIVAIVVVVAGFILYKNYISAPREAEASTELAKSQTLFNSQQYDRLSLVSRRFRVTIAALMLATLQTFMLHFAMHIRLSQTGQRRWRTQRSLAQATTR